MAKIQARKKLQKELTSFLSDPPPHIPLVAVDERDILEWYFLIEGPPNTDYAGGWFIGRLRFPPEYPFKPPGIMMLTPNGRFKTGTRLCLSMSDFHPETWNPMWSVATVLTGVLSFMLEETPTTGSIECPPDERRHLAGLSPAWNIKNAKLSQLFPELRSLVAKGQPHPDRPGDLDEWLGKMAGLSISEPAQDEEAAAGGGAGAEAAPEEAGGPDPQEEEADEALARALESAAEELKDGEPEAALSRLERTLKASKPGQAAWGPARRAAVLVLRARAQAATGDLAAAGASLSEAGATGAGGGSGASGRSGGGGAQPSPSSASSGGDLREILSPFAAHLNCSLPVSLTMDVGALLAAVKAAEAAKGKGNDAFKGGKLPDARKAYEEAIGHWPSCAPLHCNLAIACAKMGDHASAAKAAERALALNKDFHKARRRLADSLLASGDTSRAKEHYDILLPLFPKTDTELRENASKAGCKLP